ncbi:hypothetical protein BCD48_33265 [Pseudofrankia sp. BMG5.36]|nr:hypothetical protein BCD48_33265 [Pseudofrankia sp. BMG5.36]
MCDWLDSLDTGRRNAAMRGLSLVLAVEGPAVCNSEYGKALGGGLYELRIRHDAAELLRAHNPRLLEKFGAPPASDVLLRIFFGCERERVILIVGAYDKGSDPSPRKQQTEIDKARSRLGEYRRRRPTTPVAGQSHSFRRWWISQVRRRR